MGTVGIAAIFVRNKIVFGFGLTLCEQEKQFLEADFIQTSIKQLQQTQYYFSPVKHNAKLDFSQGSSSGILRILSTKSCQLTE